MDFEQVNEGFKKGEISFMMGSSKKGKSSLEEASKMAKVWRTNDILNRTEKILPTGMTYGKYVIQMRKRGREPLPYDSLWEDFTEEE